MALTFFYEKALYINGRFIKADSNYLYLQSKRKTLLIPHDNIQAEYRSYYTNPPTYSIGFSTLFHVGEGDVLATLEVKINLLTMRRYALGIKNKLVMNGGLFIPSIYGNVMLSPRSSFSIDIGAFIQPTYYKQFLPITEFSYRYLLGKKRRLYIDGSVGYFDITDLDPYYLYFKIGGGLQF